MVMASVGEESEMDLFGFFLADRLGKTMTELGEMPHSEYVAWSAYHKVRAQQEQLAMKAAQSRVR